MRRRRLLSLHNDQHAVRNQTRRPSPSPPHMSSLWYISRFMFEGKGTGYSFEWKIRVVCTSTSYVYFLCSQCRSPFVKDFRPCASEKNKPMVTIALNCSEGKRQKQSSSHRLSSHSLQYIGGKHFEVYPYSHSQPPRPDGNFGHCNPSYSWGVSVAQLPL